MKYCPKHDIHAENCWCCEEAEINAKGPAHREKMYRDPNFLTKRGGANAAIQQAHTAVVARLAALSPEQLDRFMAMIEGSTGAPPLGMIPVAAGKRILAAA